MVSGQGFNIIILSESRRLFRDWDQITDVDGLQINLAESEYECSAIIEKFRPDYIVVDCALGKKRTATVCQNLFNDNRIPVVRIILSSPTKQLTKYCDKQTCGWITRPFGLNQLRECISGTI
jgi:DNA-binding response OmpR family regulator